MSALLIAAAATASLFNCEIDQVAAVSVQAGKATASMIDGLPAEALKFRLSLAAGKATVDWPNSPIQVSGTQTVLPTGPDAGMVLAVAEGPCLFTEGSCATMLNYARQSDGSLKLLLTPTAISYDKDRNTRFPFLISMEGSCKPEETGK